MSQGRCPECSAPITGAGQFCEHCGAQLYSQTQVLESKAKRAQAEAEIRRAEAEDPELLALEAEARRVRAQEVIDEASKRRATKTKERVGKAQLQGCGCGCLAFNVAMFVIMAICMGVAESMGVDTESEEFSSAVALPLLIGGFVAGWLAYRWVMKRAAAND